MKNLYRDGRRQDRDVDDLVHVMLYYTSPIISPFFTRNMSLLSG